MVTDEPISSGRSAEDREFLLRSLEDLEREHDAGDLTDDDYLALKARYEAKLDASGPNRARDGARDWDKKRRWGRVVGAIAVVGVVGVVAGLGMARWSGSREPGQQLSGRAITTSDEQMARAARLFQEGDASGAIDIYRSLLDENPEDVAALTYLGWTLRNVAVQQEEPRLMAAGVGFIDEATQVDPTYAEAWFFRGIIFLRDEDEPDKAVDALRLVLANDPIPEIEAAARELLAEIAQSS